MDGPRRPTRGRLHPGVDVEHVALPDALRRLGAGSTGVLVAEAVLAATVAEAPRLARSPTARRDGPSVPAGPGLFAPAEGTTSDLAGQGVADPSPMLLATALLLSEGLGRTSAGVALEESLSAALRGPPPLDAAATGVAATTASSSTRSLLSLPERAPVTRSSRWALDDEDQRAATRSSARSRPRASRLMFGIPGGAIMPTRTTRWRGARQCATSSARHRSRARDNMAQGYARVFGRVGVAIATSGLGATNLVTPIAGAPGLGLDAARLHHGPGALAPDRHLYVFQECDIVGITLPIVKHSWLVQDARETPGVMRAAFHVARTGLSRASAPVDVPKDLQEALIDFSYRRDVDLPAWLEAADEGAPTPSPDPRGGDETDRERP